MKLKKILQNLLLAIASVAVFFAIAEGLTVLLWDYKLQERHVGVVISDSHKRIVHEGVEYVTNSLGLRERELNKRPDAQKTILVLGDSFIWGDGIPVESLVTTKLEKRLNELGYNIEVVNGGGGGGNAESEYSYLLKLAPIYKPSEVIVFFFTNDILDEKPVKDDSKPRVAKSWRQNIKEFLRSRLHFFAFLYYLYKDRLVEIIGVPKSLLPSDYFNLSDKKPGWKSFKDYALKMRDYCKKNNIAFHYVIIPTLTCLNDKYPYKEMHDKLKQFFSDSEIEYFDLFPVFSPYRPSKLWVNLENSHWNDLGTSLAADALIKRRSLLQDAE
jgi:lysophospholipase L1-like esterase